MKQQVNLLFLLLCLYFMASCQQKEDCGKCDEEAKTYIYEKSKNDWIQIYKQGDNLYLRFSQNPSETIPLTITEEGKDYLTVSIKSKQKNANGGNKIEGQIKLAFRGEDLEVSGLAADHQILTFKSIKDNYLTLFLPVRKRKVHTKIGQSTFIREERVSENFYQNLAQVLCYYGILYEEREGKIYVSKARYYEEEELMWNCTIKAHDVQWLAEHSCKE